MVTLGVFAAIFDGDGRILCVRMNYATHAWTTPGGGVEPGESPLAALEREVLEESGVVVVADDSSASTVSRTTTTWCCSCGLAC
jgi:8-oxo-dGTP diphosphatase